MKKRINCEPLSEQEWLGNVVEKKLVLNDSEDKWVITVAQIIAEELESQTKGHYSYIRTDSLNNIKLASYYDLIALVRRLNQLGLILDIRKEK
jgi:hypothetical protein